MRILLASLLLGLGAVVAQGATFVVSNTADSGPGSLRQAIANANAAPGPDTIDFSIGTGAQTINVASPLVVTSPLIIDGATQEGFTGTPLITLFSVGTSDGLVFAGGADASVVRNLELARFYGPDPTVEAAAISITGANNVTVAGNYLGGPRGGVLFRNRTGIHIYTDGNTIGGLTSADRNVGVDEAYEVHLESTADANVIQGNYFGFDPTGLVAQFPATLDVWINGGSGNVVGGTQPGARNVMLTSGACVQISNGARNNRVEGNYLGLNANGLAPAPRFGSSAGIALSRSGGGNIIGGSTAAARNIISNHYNGIGISQAGGVDIIRGNFIGTDPSGLTAIPNEIGILGIFSPDFATFIGGSAPGEGNLISGNSQHGIELGNTLAFVQGNLIGTTSLVWPRCRMASPAFT